MAQRHKNRRQYFEEQAKTTAEHVIPYINTAFKLDSSSRILEIGCGEGGNLKPFLELGCEVLGVDINGGQLERAAEYHSDNDYPGNWRFIHQDIYKVSEKDIGQFDVIMMRDVIEHIPNQEVFIPYLNQFVADGGIIFFGYPPWYMPFGGHQQMCSSKLGKLPWIHLLPRTWYAKYMDLVGEQKRTIETRLEIYDTGISIERFRKIVNLSGYKWVKQTLWILNPNYETKFGLKPFKCFWPLTKIPFFRNLYCTCHYAIITPKR